MINSNKIIVVMPARNVEKTLEKTYDEIPKSIVDAIILVDNASTDSTVSIAKRLGIKVIKHKVDKGYGGSQKKLYQIALQDNADIIIMVHPDYQYDASLIPKMIKPILQNKKDIVFGSRMKIKGNAIKGGMPYIKYVLNILFCKIENFILKVNFSEHFSGFRAYNKKIFDILPYQNFSDDFIFDQEIMISAIAANLRIGEISIPTRYFSEASSINFLKGSSFLIDTIKTLILFKAFKYKLYVSPIFKHKQLIN